MKKIAILTAVFIFLISSAFISPSAIADTSYQVQSGDTIWEISRSFDIPMEVIIENNDLGEANQLKEGQELKISANDNQIIISLGENEETEYTVDWGDSLYLISEKFDVSVSEIQQRNNLDSREIYYGQTLIIPVTSNDENDQDEVYTVQYGDSLWTIAQKFDTTIPQLIELNDLGDNHSISPGQKLLISETEQTDDNQEPVDDREDRNNIQPYTFYEVKEGDRIWNIAHNFGLTVGELLNSNHISRTNYIEPGDILVIPLNKSENYSYLTEAAQKLKNTYRVQPGETLTEIAEYFEIPEKGLRILNDLETEDEVRNYQLLKMPVNPGLFKKHELYQVGSEPEYLFNIAYEKGVSVRAVQKANYLTDPNTEFEPGTTVLVTLDEDSFATWIDYEDGKPVGSIFFGK